MYYHLTYYPDGNIEILSMNKLDFKFLSLYEKCIQSNCNIIFSGKLVDSQEGKNSVIINSEDDVIKHLAFLSDEESEDYQELKNYYYKYKEDLVNEV